LFDWPINLPPDPESGNNGTPFRLEVRDNTSGDYGSDTGDCGVTSDIFGVLLGEDPVAWGSSRILPASSLATSSTRSSLASEATEVLTFTGSLSLSRIPRAHPKSSSIRHPHISSDSKTRFQSNIGAIAGGVVGGLVAVAIIFGAILQLLKRRKSKEKDERLAAGGDEKIANGKARDGVFLPYADDHGAANADLREWIPKAT
jgi:hypothetical protein